MYHPYASIIPQRVEERVGIHDEDLFGMTDGHPEGQCNGMSGPIFVFESMIRLIPPLQECRVGTRYDKSIADALSGKMVKTAL